MKFSKLTLSMVAARHISLLFGTIVFPIVTSESTVSDLSLLSQKSLNNRKINDTDAKVASKERKLQSQIWNQVGTAIDGAYNYDNSGYSVSLSGDGRVVAIGAPNSNINGWFTAAAGYVRVYEYDGDGWTQRGSDIDGQANYEYFGASLSLSSDGNVLAVGARDNDGYGNYSGLVRIYHYVNDAWIQLGNAIYGEGFDDHSGYSVSLSSNGSVLAIGAVYNYGNGNAAGHVRVYEYINNAWTQRGDDIDGEAAEDLSGYSVSLSSDGNVVAIGAPYNDGDGTAAGHVRVYEYSSSEWTQLGTDIDGDDSADMFGVSVSLSSDGHVVAIGATNCIDEICSSSYVRVYEHADDDWIQRGREICGEAGSDKSGFSVSLSDDGNIVAIGAPGNDGYDNDRNDNDGNDNDGGHVYVYEFIDGDWTQLGTDIDGEANNDEFGYSVSLSSDGSIVAIGAPAKNGSSKKAMGQVQVYQYTTSKVASNPTYNPSSKPTSNPTFKPTTSKPTTKPTSKKPTTKPTSNKPTTKPTSNKPTSKPTSNKPTTKPTSKKPTTNSFF